MRGKKKKVRKKQIPVKTGQPMTFFKKEKIWLEEMTSEDKGILNFCCENMQEACEDTDLHKNPSGCTYYKTRSVINGGGEFNSEEGIGCYTHQHESYEWCNYNWKQFNFCPWCGTKINGVVSTIEDLR